MNLNSDNCHQLLVSGHHYKEMFVNIAKDEISERKSVKLFGITIDIELRFNAISAIINNKNFF